MKASAMLKRAKAIVARGWIQGKMSDCYGRRCALGALLAVEDERRVIAIRCFKVAAGIVGKEVVLWNDAPSRTQAEVVATFGRAIRIAQAAGL